MRERRSELIPAVEVALARFSEEQAGADESVEDRRSIDLAKARLMDTYGLTEADSVAFIHADGDAVTRAVAVIEGNLRP